MDDTVVGFVAAVTTLPVTVGSTATMEHHQQDILENDDDEGCEQDYEEFDDDSVNSKTTATTNFVWPTIKLITAATFALSALHMLRDSGNNNSSSSRLTMPYTSTSNMSNDSSGLHNYQSQQQRRRLSETEIQMTEPWSDTNVPQYMNRVFNDLKERNKLFDETPPEEVKYWFEYTGALQKYFYRFSKSRGKADYFEGRDDSGVISSRFVESVGGNDEFRSFYVDNDFTGIPNRESSIYTRVLENCIAMGAPTRPDTTSPLWTKWFGGEKSNPLLTKDGAAAADRCRILFAINTVGAGRGTTMIWETNPPKKYVEGPSPWTSEQETAVTHIQRNLQEIDAMCASGLFAARVQIMVCEPIPSVWTEWLDAQLPNCGGQPFSYTSSGMDTVNVEDRPSPVQIVVSASAQTADTCHDLKSGFMEKRVQDILFATPQTDKVKNIDDYDPTIKTTHPDLFSSADHDLYVAIRWSSLITIRAVHSFLRASADIAAAASASSTVTVDPTINTPGSPFLIPSFVRVSYVSEENPKVAKWRMHGDFFHPAAWEICKDSFDMTFIPHSLSGEGGIRSICDDDSASAVGRKLSSDGSCGQWWVYFTELQMPTSPEVYANEVTPPPVEGGSNFVWMVTDRQRREVVKSIVCLHHAHVTNDKDAKCPALPQAVIPLGDLESFLINYTPNTGLGREHVVGRRPGYSHEQEREKERAAVKERKQLNGQDEIEAALFDYTVYPAALFHKDATIKAVRARDRALTTSKHTNNNGGPQTVKSSYYDVTITKPRPPLLGLCQAVARKGLCTLYADYFRVGTDTRCAEACGLSKDFTRI